MTRAQTGMSSKKTPLGRTCHQVISEIEKFLPSTRVTAPPTDTAAVSVFDPTIASFFPEYRVAAQPSWDAKITKS